MTGKLVVGVLAAVALGLGGCGAAKKTGTPVAGEGEQCQPGSSTCPTGEACTPYSGYQAPFQVCRTACSSGCSDGETCGSDTTCQCTPTLTPGETGDPCIAIGLICHPDFKVCASTLPAGSSCPAGEVYSMFWSLCRVG